MLHIHWSAGTRQPLTCHGAHAPTPTATWHPHPTDYRERPTHRRTIHSHALTREHFTQATRPSPAYRARIFHSRCAEHALTFTHPQATSVHRNTHRDRSGLLSQNYIVNPIYFSSLLTSGFLFSLNRFTFLFSTWNFACVQLHFHSRHIEHHEHSSPTKENLYNSLDALLFLT